MIKRRGMLIVLEGCDGCGKSTQARKLVDALNTTPREGEGSLGGHVTHAELWKFPNRDTAIGRLIDEYLQNKCEMEDHAIHLLFAANRWEMVPCLLETLEKGISVIMDRYAFSGLAFSAAKKKKLGFQWCKIADQGLPRPDLVLYLSLSSLEMEARWNKKERDGTMVYIRERYEKVAFQNQVQAEYGKLMMGEDNWHVIEVNNKSIEVIHRNLLNIIKDNVKISTEKVIGKLWL
ncbi:hypothetical protein CAPTEDRAFT_110243 [Capitella teleta]|uniref:Thymidylate kinase n=1 Tax=Capitella teleta TaxID=283909 RepID=R7UT21_CAPTE|nr:hypothetical protein CAPTEDRAFT_104860 [Capitella teleta]ELU09318.1 hypothetical protein CAPTEDRAFT_110243 [Capitella teleta]|eukprot:ELU05444.1 hypothetical protein CAPTEDRAFT_104860 [Capitella teleta]